MNTNIIETHNLTKGAGSHLRVNHIDLRIPEGCVYGFLGPNGNTWKLLETLQSKFALYLAKILYGFVGIFIFSVAELAILFLLGHQIGFMGSPDLWAYALHFMFTLLITFHLFLLQMILSLVFHNQAIALCTGICGSMAGLFLPY